MQLSWRPTQSKPDRYVFYNVFIIKHAKIEDVQVYVLQNSLKISVRHNIRLNPCLHLDHRSSFHFFMWSYLLIMLLFISSVHKEKFRSYVFNGCMHFTDHIHEIFFRLFWGIQSMKTNTQRLQLRSREFTEAIQCGIITIFIYYTCLGGQTSVIQFDLYVF